MREQWVALKQLLGHYGYFGITGNYRALNRFLYRVIRAWRHWLSRRSQRAYLSWGHMLRLLQHYELPPPRIRSAPVT